MKHIKLFENFFLNERLTDVNDDVDMIYNKYFKEGYEYIKANNKVDLSLFKTDEFSTEELQSPLCKKAHETNPCTIYINNPNKRNNHYSPSTQTISIRYNNYAMIHAMEYSSLTLASKFLDDVGQAKQFLREFEESTIKGSIHHELVHWIDDSLNNRHLNAKLMNRTSPIKNVNFTYFEIQSQIHNIVQLKRKFEDEWDDLTFGEMVELSPSLTQSSLNPDYDAKVKWIKSLKKRMAREGLLGKNMYN